MFGKNVSSHVSVLGCNCVAAIEAGDFRCSNFGCCTFLLQGNNIMDKTQIKTGYPSIDRPWEKYYSDYVLNYNFPSSTMYQCIFDCNKEHMNRVAMEYFGRTYTYSELFEGIDETARALVAFGVHSSDIITIAMPTTPEVVYLLYAISKIGAIANMIDPRTSKEGIYDYTNEAQSKLFIAIDLCYPKINDIREATCVEKLILISAGDSLTGIKSLVYSTGNFVKGIFDKSVRIKESDTLIRWNSFIGYRDKVSDIEENHDGSLPAVILHTGGTTGTPKGVVLSSICFNTIAYQYKLSGMHLFPGQRFLDIMPPFIAYGVGAGLHMPFVIGMTALLIPKFEPESFAKMIRDLKPNHMAGVPSHWGNVLNSHLLQNYDLSFLITPAVGGDGMDLKLERSANAFLDEHKTPNRVIKGYGMTEQCSLAAACVNEINAEGSVGIPLPQNVIAIFNPETGEELTYNQKGEVCLCGPTTMIGYFDNETATNEVIRIHDDGRRWIHSGDLGYMTEDGLLFIDGRIKRMIIRHDGFKVFPTQIEKVILNDQSIRAACVVGVSDDEHAQGKLPVAFIVINDATQKDTSIAKAKALCSEELPEYAQPIRIKVIKEMPLTPIGKVDYRTLEEMAKEGESDER